MMLLIYSNGSLQWGTNIDQSVVLNLLSCKSLMYCIDMETRQAMFLQDGGDGKSQIVKAEIAEWKMEFPQAQEEEVEEKE